MEFLPAPDESFCKSHPQNLPAPRTLPADHWPSPEPKSWSLGDVIALLGGHKLALFLFTLGGTLAGFLTYAIQRPVYRATAHLEIQHMNEDFLNLRSMMPSDESSPAAFDASLVTQAELLRDDGLLSQVITRLNLGAYPEFGTSAGKSLVALLGLNIEPYSSMTPDVCALRELKDHLAVQPVRQGRLIRVDVESLDPNLAARIVSTLMELFINRDTQSRMEAVRRTETVLLGQIDELRRELGQSETNLQSYARRNRIVNTNRASTTAEERLAQLETQLVAAQIERISREAERVSPNTPVTSVRRVAEDPVVRELHSKLNSLRAQQAELLAIYQPAYHKVQSTREEIEEVQRSLNEYVRSVAERIELDYRVARSREQLIEKAKRDQEDLVAGQAMAQAGFNVLQREVDTNRKLYEQMLQRVREAGVAATLQASGARVAAPATVPEIPVKPVLLLNSLFGLLCGLGFGTVLIILLESTDTRLRHPGDVLSQLNVAELGAIPERHRVLADSDSRPVITALSRALPQPAHNDALGLLAGPSGDVQFEECIRGVLHSLLAANSREGAQMAVVVSPSPFDGKTTMVAHLGIALAETERNVLLVDGDLRNPRLHEVLDIPNTWGLSSLLTDRTSLRGITRQMLARETSIPRLHVLPSGPGVDNISRLLRGRRLEQLARSLHEQFDVILVDTPAALSFSDYRALGRVSDGAVLVVNARRTAAADALEVVERLNGDGIPILGGLLNSWDPRRRGHAYGYPYYAHAAR